MRRLNMSTMKHKARTNVKASSTKTKTAELALRRFRFPDVLMNPGPDHVWSIRGNDL